MGTRSRGGRENECRTDSLSDTQVHVHCPSLPVYPITIHWLRFGKSRTSTFVLAWGEVSHPDYLTAQVE